MIANENQATQFVNDIIFDGVGWLDEFEEGQSWTWEQYETTLKECVLMEKQGKSGVVTQEALAGYGLTELDVSQVNFKAIAKSMKRYELACDDSLSD